MRGAVLEKSFVLAGRCGPPGRSVAPGTRKNFGYPCRNAMWRDFRWNRPMATDKDNDPDLQALIQWCTEVEELLVAAGASREEAQDYIEQEAEWFTDQFYEGLTPEEAAKASLNDQ